MVHTAFFHQISIAQKNHSDNLSIRALYMFPTSASNIWLNWVYKLVPPSVPPKYSTLYVPFLFPRDPIFPITQLFSQNTLIQELDSILIQFSTISPAKKYLHYHHF